MIYTTATSGFSLQQVKIVMFTHYLLKSEGNNHCVRCWIVNFLLMLQLIALRKVPILL